MKKNIEVFCPTKGLAEDMIKFAARKLVLKSEVVLEDKEGFIVRIYRASDKDLELIKKHRKFRGASIKVFSTIDRGAEKVISGADFIARDLAVPAIKAGARIASGIVSTGFKAGVTALGGMLNASADNYKRVRDDLRSDPEVRELLGRFKASETETPDVWVSPDKK